MDSGVWLSVISGVGLVLTYTCTIAIVVMWLSTKFGSLEKVVESRLSKEEWNTAHTQIRSELKDVDTRLRKMELWQAGRPEVVLAKEPSAVVHAPLFPTTQRLDVIGGA